MRIQLWSYNFDPEPSGIGPVSTAWAHALQARGHEIVVVAAHPHYPKPIWGHRVRPYRERHEGVPVLRLPLWIGRDSGIQRIRQELSYTGALGAVAPVLPSADVMVAVSPSFPALLPAMVHARVRRMPWILWLQDILPEGAATTGLIDRGPALKLATWLERAPSHPAYRIVVISDVFAYNLLRKGVPASKLTRIYNPSPAPVPPHASGPPRNGRRRVLVMGNVGHSPGPAAVVRTPEESRVLEETDTELRISGHGMAAGEVAETITTDRVRMLGLISKSALQDELRHASLGLVTQRGDVAEFNLPSKFMHCMANSLPTFAVVNPESETARLVETHAAGWVAS